MPLSQEHTREAIRARLALEARPNYARDVVYGAIDGSVTTFAIVAGVNGAELPSKVIVILGVAKLLADAISMGASIYSGTKAEADDFKRIYEIERRHIAEVPDGEREEIRQILAKKGLTGQALDEAVEAITSNEETWIKTMLAEEYGLSTVLRRPLTSGLCTFGAFMLAGAVPLLPYLLGLMHPFQWSLALVALSFFAIGSLKSRWAVAPWWKSGLETLAIGLSAATAAYLVGRFLQSMGLSA